MNRGFKKDGRVEGHRLTKIPRQPMAIVLLPPSRLSAAIAPLVALESVDSSWRAARSRPCAARRIGPAIAETRIEAAIHRAPPIARATKPGSGANEGAIVKPRRPVVAIRCAAVRRKVKVAVRADGRGTDIHAEADLRCCIGSCYCSQQNSC